MTKIFEIVLEKSVLNWYYFGLKVIRSYKNYPNNAETGNYFSSAALMRLYISCI